MTSYRYLFILPKRQLKKDKVVYPRIVVCGTVTRWTRCSYTSRK